MIEELSPATVSHGRLICFDLVTNSDEFLYSCEHIIRERVEHLQTYLGVLFIESLDLVSELFILSQDTVERVIGVIPPLIRVHGGGGWRCGHDT